MSIGKKRSPTPPRAAKRAPDKKRVPKHARAPRSTAQKKSQALARMWATLMLLRSTRRGATAKDIQRAVGSSRSTFYRDIAILLASDVPIQKDTVNGEARYRLLEPPRTTGLEPMQHYAISIARHALRGLAGTKLLKTLDSISRPPSRARLTIDQKPAAVAPSIAQQLELYIERDRRIRIRYRGARDEAERTRELDPGALHLRGGHLYLYAFDLERNDWRTFKAARITWIEEVGPAKRHPGLDKLQRREHAVAVWSGEPTDVTIRLDKEIAWLLPEYPLVQGQREETQPDGSVLLHATVAGLIETTRWIIGWGQHAEAIAPKALRAAVRAELQTASARYGK